MSSRRETENRKFRSLTAPRQSAKYLAQKSQNGHGASVSVLASSVAGRPESSFQTGRKALRKVSLKVSLNASPLPFDRPNASPCSPSSASSRSSLGSTLAQSLARLAASASFGKSSSIHAECFGFAPAISSIAYRILFDDDAGSEFSPDPVSWFGGISPVNNSSNFSAKSPRIFARRSATAALDGHRDAICEISALTNASRTPSYILRAQKITSGSLLIFSGKNLARRFENAFQSGRYRRRTQPKPWRRDVVGH